MFLFLLIQWPKTDDDLDGTTGAGSSTTTTAVVAVVAATAVAATHRGVGNRVLPWKTDQEYLCESPLSVQNYLSAKRWLFHFHTFTNDVGLYRTTERGHLYPLSLTHKYTLSHTNTLSHFPQPQRHGHHCRHAVESDFVSNASSFLNCAPACMLGHIYIRTGRVDCVPDRQTDPKEPLTHDS